MTEFWEIKFREEKIMWGVEPSDSAILAKNIFLTNNIKDILIPGIGYGRNTKIFIDHGIKVTGIEISKSAIDLAKNSNELDIKIHHGSVTQMPYEDKKYDGIFCYALVHLLGKPDRKRLIQNCYNQLKPKGIMIFVVVSKQATIFGKGKQISKDRYRLMQGLNVYFYDLETVKHEFKNYGIIDSFEIDEPIKHMDNEPPLKCIFVKCQKT